jgi:hypothetical protein
MLHRILPATLALGAVALLAVACDTGPTDAYYYDHAQAVCAQYSTCGACTPVAGCGWCFNADGTGSCAPGPDGCRTQEFSWTWDQAGCRSGATDAGVGGHDASPLHPDDAASEATHPVLDAATDADAQAD